MHLLHASLRSSISLIYVEAGEVRAEDIKLPKSEMRAPDDQGSDECGLSVRLCCTVEYGVQEYRILLGRSTGVLDVLTLEYTWSFCGVRLPPFMVEYSLPFRSVEYSRARHSRQL